MLALESDGYTYMYNVHVYTSLINMVIGDAIIGCNFLSFLLIIIKSIFRCREKLAKL